MKSKLIVLGLLLTGALTYAITARYNALWDASPDAPSVSGYNVAVTRTNIATLNLFDTASPTNTAVLAWQFTSNTSISFGPLLAGLPSGPYSIWISARGTNLLYSDWLRANFTNEGGIPRMPANFQFQISVTP